MLLHNAPWYNFSQGIRYTVQEYKMVSDTLFLGVSCIDRYLSIANVPRAQLQLVGVTCMMLAAKYEEIYAPTVRPLSHLHASMRTLLVQSSAVIAHRKQALLPMKCMPSTCVRMHDLQLELLCKQNMSLLLQHWMAILSLWFLIRKPLQDMFA